MELRKQSALNYVRHPVSQTSIVTPRGVERGAFAYKTLLKGRQSPSPPPTPHPFSSGLSIKRLL